MVEELGALVDEEGGGSKDIMNQLKKVCRGFQKLGKVWAVREDMPIQDFNLTGHPVWL